ncbi:hypothetical protein Ddc_22076 [Ditylenchus destructor]|nr:hypothetical protein Ddc_22076 [Ditylenchus destructor]
MRGLVAAIFCVSFLHVAVSELVCPNEGYKLPTDSGCNPTDKDPCPQIQEAITRCEQLIHVPNPSGIAMSAEYWCCSQHRHHNSANAFNDIRPESPNRGHRQHSIGPANPPSPDK